MAQRDVDEAREWYTALNRWLEAYWANPERPLGETPGTDDLFERMEPGAEWDWLFTPDTFVGREQLLGAAADWIETVDAWELDVEDVLDGTDGRVVAIVRVLARGRGSGTPVHERVFSAITVRDGKIARIEDYTDRAKALEAAGLGE
jgi:ketosteroid isomerase-like protein